MVSLLEAHWVRQLLMGQRKSDGAGRWNFEDGLNSIFT